ncbi:MAG TPA: hypothetical protein VGB40_02970 [Rubrobacteraceae bacterium]
MGLSGRERVYDRGETEDGTCYIAMEYVPGGTLKEWLGEMSPLESREAAAMAVQIAGALGAPTSAVWSTATQSLTTCW